jgi:hypothetical protein
MPGPEKSHGVRAPVETRVLGDTDPLSSILAFHYRGSCLRLFKPPSSLTEGYRTGTFQ